MSQRDTPEIDAPSRIDEHDQGTVPTGDEPRDAVHPSRRAAQPSWRRALPTLGGLVVLVGIGVGANALVAARSASLAEAGPAAGAAPRALPVETTVLEAVDSIVVARTFSGTVAARRDADLSFEGSGRVQRVLAEEGALVEEGAVLAELDTELLDAQRAEIASQRAGLEARLAELLSGPRVEVIDAARADLEAIDQALELAKLQRDRRSELVQRGTVSVEQLDTLTAEVRTLEARRAAARARLAELENGTRIEVIAAQRGALAEIEAGLRSIDVRIARAKLVAPFRGVIAARFVDEGVVVSEQMPNAAFRIVEADALEARIGVPTGTATLLRGTDDTLELRVGERIVESIRLRELPTVDSGTRTVTLVFDLEPGSARDAGVRPGDIATLVVATVEDERGAWIPLSALSESTRGLWSAFAVADIDSPRPRAERVELEILRAETDRAFVRGTFDGTLTIVRSGAHRLVPGQWLQPLPMAPRDHGATDEN